MSQMISIASKRRKDGAVRDRPEISDAVIWRRDGENNQIILLSKEDLALPLILNLTAARIFSLCNGKNTPEDIAGRLCAESGISDFEMVLKDVKKQVKYFYERGIVLSRKEEKKNVEDKN